MDGVVIRVLLNKAREIHQALGTHVPVPEESETVTQAVLKALFFRGRTVEEAIPQMELGLEIPEVAALHRSWDLDVARERENRTRFAQRALKPDEVRQELEATDAVLGDPDAVRLFVLSAAQRLGVQITEDRRSNIFRVIVSPEARASLPTAITAALPVTKTGHWFVSFHFADAGRRGIPGAQSPVRRHARAISHGGSADQGCSRPRFALRRHAHPRRFPADSFYICCGCVS